MRAADSPRPRRSAAGPLAQRCRKPGPACPRQDPGDDIGHRPLRARGRPAATHIPPLRAVVPPGDPPPAQRLERRGDPPGGAMQCPHERGTRGARVVGPGAGFGHLDPAHRTSPSLGVLRGFEGKPMTTARPEDGAAMAARNRVQRHAPASPLGTGQAGIMGRPGCAPRRPPQAPRRSPSARRAGPPCVAGAPSPSAGARDRRHPPRSTGPG